jgi:hypothetical protein
VSSTAETGYHDMAEILLGVASKHNKLIKYNCEHFKNFILEFARPSNYQVSGGRHRGTRREFPTMGKQLVNFIPELPTPILPTSATLES